MLFLVLFTTTIFLNAAARRLRRGSQVSVRRPDGTFGVTSFTDRGGTFDLFMQLRVHVGDQAAPTDLILGAQAASDTLITFCFSK